MIQSLSTYIIISQNLLHEILYYIEFPLILIYCHQENTLVLVMRNRIISNESCLAMNLKTKYVMIREVAKWYNDKQDSALSAVVLRNIT